MQYNIFLSRTFWTILSMFVIGGMNAVMAFLPAPLQTAAMAVLSVMAVYFHTNPSQNYSPNQNG